MFPWQLERAYQCILRLDHRRYVNGNSLWLGRKAGATGDGDDLLRKVPETPVVNWLEVRDTIIAGIVLANRATLATRNTQHFADLPLTVINPWAL